MITVVGSYLSPYVRKALVCLDMKGLRYQIDPIVPFFGSDEFSRISPLRRVPVLLDDQVILSDSTVICEYLNERYPEPALLPQDVAQRAQSRWLEEFADSRMGDVMIWRFYHQLVIKRFVWREQPDMEMVEQSRNQDIPQILDYLEGLLPTQGTFFDTVTIADIAVASFFRNAGFAGLQVDAEAWPRVAEFLAQMHALPAFIQLQTFENLSLKTPIPELREALKAAGAPISEHSYGAEQPRMGMFELP
jgi:glutathione S-transferase